MINCQVFFDTDRQQKQNLALIFNHNRKYSFCQLKKVFFFGGNDVTSK
jgi:hypothetical protein